MKLTPIAQGSGVPAGTVGQERTSADRIAIAKQIAAGQSPIRHSPSDTPTEKQKQDVRRIKMRTNVSPERYGEPVDTAESPISDTTEQVDATAEETKPISPQFAALARQKRALQVKEREIADREKALESKTSNDGTSDLVARLKSNPLSVLQEAGVSYDDLTQAILANPSTQNPELQALKDEIKALKEGVDKTFTDRDTQAEQSVLSDMRREADRLTAQGDEYEMVRETKSQAQVIDLIHKTYKQTGEILDVKEALQLVEDDLIDESLKIARINKIQSRLTPAQTEQEAPQRQMRTLTARDGATAPMSRRERAFAAFNGTLKNK
jgi:hypothetical protein